MKEKLEIAAAWAVAVGLILALFNNERSNPMGATKPKEKNNE